MEFNEKKESIKTKLVSTREDLLETITNIPENSLNVKVSSHDGAWSVVEVIRHLVSAEYGQTRLIEEITEGNEGVPSDFDLNRYNKRQISKLNDTSISDLINKFNQNRTHLITVLDKLTGEDFGKQGRHASLHMLTIEQIFHVIADHEKGHLDKIRKALV